MTDLTLNDALKIAREIEQYLYIKDRANALKNLDYDGSSLSVRRSPLAEAATELAEFLASIDSIEDIDPETPADPVPTVATDLMNEIDARLPDGMAIKTFFRLQPGGSSGYWEAMLIQENPVMGVETGTAAFAASTEEAALQGMLDGLAVSL